MPFIGSFLSNQEKTMNPQRRPDRMGKSSVTKGKQTTKSPQKKTPHEAQKSNVKKIKKGK